MDHIKLSEERLTSTKLEGYDVITAVTQRALNAQLKAMYDKNESLRRINLKSTHGHDKYTSLEAELYPPTVQLLIGAENQIVLYFLNIKTATLRYPEPDLETMSIEQKTCTFSDASIAVSVNLDLQDGHFTDLPSDRQQNLAPSGHYSINQLLIGFHSASLARFDMSHSTYEAKLDQLSPVALGLFNVFINGYFSDLSKKENRGASVLNYVPLPNANKYRMATVAPTNFTFQTIPFLTPGQTKGSLSDDNMLVYLQVTNGEGRLPQSTLTNSVNWVVPAPSDRKGERYDGTMALSRGIFLDAWLLPKLAQFNRASTWVVDEAWIEDASFLKFKLHMNGHMGWDEDINWQGIPGDSAEQWAKDRVQSWPNLGGEWFKYEKSFVKDDDGIYQRAWQKASTRNYCFIPVGYNADGKCAITVAGRTEVEVYDHTEGRTSNVRITGTWSTQIVIGGAEDGEFRITATNIEPIVEKDRHYAPSREGNLDYLLDQVENNLKQLNGNFDGDFVLPGAADFSTTRAAFNRNMDLLCELKYRD